MPKGKIAHDVLETMAELGVSTAKKTVKSVKSTGSPSDFFQEIVGNRPAGGDSKEVHKQVGEHSKIDLKEIGEKHDQEDKIKEQAIRSRLFQLVKEGEKKSSGEREQEEQERVQHLAAQARHKKKKDEEKRRSEGAGEIPQGKVRRSIFSHKKVAARQGVETRASSGKQ